MDAEAALDRAVREAGDRIRAALAVRFRDLDAAEEAFAFACAAAVEAWRRQDPPRDPAAWLYAAGRRRALDLGRRARVRAANRPEPPEPEPTPEDVVIAAFEPIPDERLRLIFVCCHPAIAAEARVALTLRTLCGLSMERLAAAFLVGEIAMVQRLTRARRKIRDARIGFEIPGPDRWAERLEAVLATLEIAYAQAYADAAGASDAAGLAEETLRLTGLLAELIPDDPEVLGLAALVRLAEARRAARLDPSGVMIPLGEQDVRLWDRPRIAEAVGLMRRAAAQARSGPYQIMAAIHMAHASRADTGATPWDDIVGLYDALMVVRPSPVAAINRAIALEPVAGAAEALAALDAADPAGRLAGFAPWHAARAHLCQRAGRLDEAAAELERTIALTDTPAERRFLVAKLRRLRPSQRSAGAE